jgi:hypothetical protein
MKREIIPQLRIFDWYQMIIVKRAYLSRQILTDN